MNRPWLTIVCCTARRESLIPELIQEVAQQATQENGRVETLVIDNAARASIEYLPGVNANPSVRTSLLHRPVMNLSVARNIGISQADGGIVAFVDDDVVLGPGWLSSLRAAAERYPSAVGFGGRVNAEWLRGIPDWVMALKRCHHGGGAFTGHELGSQERPYTSADQPPIGCNMAFRRELFKACGVFRPELGMTASRLVYGDDTEFGRRVQAHGGTIVYVPGMVVSHTVTWRKMSKGYVLRSAHALGKYIGQEISLGHTRHRTGARARLCRVLEEVGRAIRRATRAELRISGLVLTMEVLYLCGLAIGCAGKLGDPPAAGRGTTLGLQDK